jgi:hypothetical protein
MKRFLTIAFILAGAIVAAPAIEANTVDNSSSAISNYKGPQVPWNRGRRWNNNRRVRVVTTTRTRRVGFRVFRETVRTTYFPNGRVTTQVISRVRIR